MPPTSNFLGFRFRPILDIFISKTWFWGFRTITNASASKFWSHIQVSMPQSEFSEAFQIKVHVLKRFLQGRLFGPSAFSEFTNFFKCGVFTGSHAHQWMRLEKLIWKNTVSARDLDYEIKIFKKSFFKSVRRPCSSWSDRRSFQLFV